MVLHDFPPSESVRSVWHPWNSELFGYILKVMQHVPL
jgi:hypothetical protein